ncbi:MAG: thiamine pyrophosphate-dependent enzyme [Candidatus Sericytochromatia bacterium]|nr:thiamine pyrophosphate-dependent enzyme [Candidatus Sericytochromatia bacterium]
MLPATERSFHGALSSAEQRRLYRTMVLMREIHHRAIALQRQGRIGSWLGSEGQEAAIVGSAFALQPEDWAFPSYREHALALVRGIPVVRLFHHLYANAADSIVGRNLPPEYSFREVHFVSVSAPVGNQVPQAVGAAMAKQVKGEPGAVITYFGDGTSSEGDIHTGMAVAARRRAPVVFVCQNNGWAISVPTARQTAGDIVRRAPALGMVGVRVDGNDALAVHQVVAEALDRARRGEGPTLVEAMTYRLGAHSTSDDPSRYRPEGELEDWRARDPLPRLARALGFTADECHAIAQDVREEIDRAVEEAEQTPQPQLSTMFDDVYAERPWHLEEQARAVLSKT